MCTIERRTSGVCGAGLNLDIIWKACSVREYVREREKASLVEVESACRSETRTRRVIDKHRIDGRSQVAG